MIDLILKENETHDFPAVQFLWLTIRMTETHGLNSLLICSPTM